MQSTPASTILTFTPDAARKNATDFAMAAGCSGSGKSVAQCLRGLTAARIVQLMGTPKSGKYTVFGPIVDGTILPLATDHAILSGRFNKVPVIGGSTFDESTFNYAHPEYWSGTPVTTDQFTAAAVAGKSCLFCVTGTIPNGVADLYSLSKFGGDPLVGLTRLNTDAQTCREIPIMQALAAKVPTYAYTFTYQKAPFYFPQMPGFTAKASHTIDIQFLFPGFHGGNLGVNLDQSTGQPRELNASETKLSDQLVTAWTNFARSGNPNGSGNSPWPKYTADSSAKYFVEDIPLSTTSLSEFKAAHNCDFWLGSATN